jgi:hypothetical protein
LCGDLITMLFVDATVGAGGAVAPVGAGEFGVAAGTARGGAARWTGDDFEPGPGRGDIVAEFAETDAPPYLPVDGDFDDLAADTATELHACITGDNWPAPHLATRAAIVVTANPSLRKALLRLGFGHEDTAARTWTRIANQLRGAARVLTVAAVNYYLANDATRVGIALDPHVVAIAAQPLALLWPRGTPGQKSRVPDFFVRLSDGDGRLVAVRHPARVDAAAAQFDMTRRVCAEIGWHYEVFTGWTLWRSRTCARWRVIGWTGMQF